MAGKKKLSIVDIQMALQSRVKACALCGGMHWELEPDLYALRLGNPWAPREGRALECAVLTCHDCGNTHILSAEVLRKLGAPITESAERVQLGEGAAFSDLPDDDDPPKLETT